MEFKDYYKTMGVACNASQDEIKRAYRLLARKYHPDVSKERDAEARFKEVGEANEVLKDTEKRAAYDRLSANRQAGQEFTPPPGWNNGREFSGGDTGDFSDFFESLFGRGFAAAQDNRAPSRSKGADHHAKVAIDLEDSYNGTVRSITLHGRQFNVSIPRGIRAGQHIRLTGQGTPGIEQGKAGDLYLEIEFRPHPFYRVEQHDVYLDLPVAPWEAALGAALNAPTPGGMVEVKIPAGSVAGNKLRFKGRGIPGRTPGDFYAVLQIALPPAATEMDKESYRNLATRFKSFNPRSKLGV